MLNICRHFSSFLGCIKFHALINAEDCPIRDLEAKAKAASGMGSFSICKGKSQEFVTHYFKVSVYISMYFLLFFTKETTFMTFCLIPWRMKPF